jgi:hypothetical protein
MTMREAHLKNTGSVLLMVVFVVALISVLTSGLLQINTEQIQLMDNQLGAAEAQAIAEAGLNDAFAQLRSNAVWTDGFTEKAFSGGSYTVTVSSYSGGNGLSDLTVVSTGRTDEGFVFRMRADITVDTGSVNVIRIDNLRLNPPAGG